MVHGVLPMVVQGSLRAKGSSQQSVLDIMRARDLASKSALLSLPLREEYGL